MSEAELEARRKDRHAAPGAAQDERATQNLRLGLGPQVRVLPLKLPAGA